MARCSIEAASKGEVFAPERVGEDLATTSLGAFVSLYRNGALRGCIGNCFPQKPLYQTAMEAAVSSASRDHRFSPLQIEELPEITIEISVLSPLRELGHPMELEVGRHGVYVMHGVQHGVLLPQVALQQGWNKQGFLEAACMKAGLMAGSWQMIGTRVFVFTVQLISEKS